MQACCGGKELLSGQSGYELSKQLTKHGASQTSSKESILCCLVSDLLLGLTSATPVHVSATSTFRPPVVVTRAVNHEAQIVSLNATASARSEWHKCSGDLVKLWCTARERHQRRLWIQEHEDGSVRVQGPGAVIWP